MTAHVAERGEGRGRVVLRIISTGEVSERAIDAAIHVAKAFHSEIESLFVSDRQIFDAAGYSFVREIARVGGEGGSERDIDVAAIAREVALQQRHVQRLVLALARAADVPVTERVAHSSPLGALADACQMCGPWNVVVLAEPYSASSLAQLGDLFERVTGMTGVVTVGPRASNTTGPVVAVVEDVERLTGMVRTAERLARSSGRAIAVALCAANRAAQAQLEREVAGALAGRQDVDVMRLGQPGGGTAVAAEALRQLGASFVVAEYGGVVVPGGGDLKPLVTALTCPLLIVR